MSIKTPYEPSILEMIMEPFSFKGEVHEEEAPLAFTYSLYYVYYD